MVYVSFKLKLKLKQAYDLYNEMSNETTHSWWTLGSGSLGLFHCVLLLMYVTPSLGRGKVSVIVPVLLVLSMVVVISGPIFLTNLALTYTPNSSIPPSKVKTLFKLGCLPKSLGEVSVLCVAVALRIAFEDIFACLAWILFVLQLQFFWQMWYLTRDLNLPDLLCEVLMQLLLFYHEKNDGYDFEVVCVLCVLVIYLKNCSTPSCTTIFSDSECLCEEPITPSAAENKHVDNEIP